MIGKTIKSVEHPYYDNILIRFTDGSAVEIEAVGYEVEGVELEELTPEQVRRRAARYQGYRERARLIRLKNMVPHQRPVRWWSPFAQAFEDEMTGLVETIKADVNHQVYWS